MTMLRETSETDAREAQENLRIIRGLMERSTKHSTFSGFSGIVAGLSSILGCVATQRLGNHLAATMQGRTFFLATWCLVILAAVGADYLLTKRRAAQVGKRIVSRLGKQMIIASAPGLGTGAMLTLFFLQQNMLSTIYPVWMLCYGIAVCAVGLFSQREVAYLGASFLCVGALTLLMPTMGLLMMAIGFGGFHIVYGLIMWRKDGW